MNNLLYTILRIRAKQYQKNVLLKNEYIAQTSGYRKFYFTGSPFFPTGTELDCDSGSSSSVFIFCAETLGNSFLKGNSLCGNI